MAQTFEEGIVLTESSNNGQGRAAEDQMVRGYVVELDDFRARIERFAQADPADILSDISAISGRLAEMRARLFRGTSQRCTILRTREVDPLREELEFQFKIHSRRIALMEWELRMSGGGI